MRHIGLVTLMGFVLAAHAMVNESAIKIPWSYKGNNGPARWGQLSPEFYICGKGKLQSPIDLKQQFPVTTSPNDLTVHYAPAPMQIVDDGITELTMGQTSTLVKEGRGIQLDFSTKGRPETIGFKGKTWRLVQFHLHSPSENTLNGENFPMEIHFVHQAPDGQVLMLAAFVDTGESNAELQKIITHFPLDRGVVHAIPDTINPGNLIPDKRSYYHFVGSLTSPPCTEGLQWVVMRTPIQASSAQILLFRKAVDGNNARNLQDRNDRPIVLIGNE